MLERKFSNPSDAYETNALEAVVGAASARSRAEPAVKPPPVLGERHWGLSCEPHHPQRVTTFSLPAGQASQLCCPPASKTGPAPNTGPVPSSVPKLSNPVSESFAISFSRFFFPLSRLPFNSLYGRNTLPFACMAYVSQSGHAGTLVTPFFTSSFLN